jgi:hypothetical protein
MKGGKLKNEKASIYYFFSSAQPASSSYPLLQQYQNQRLSTDRGISRNAL